MLPARFEPAIPESERPQTHTLYRAGNGMGRTITYEINLKDYGKNKLSETKAWILCKYLTYLKEANCKKKSCIYNAPCINIVILIQYLNPERQCHFILIGEFMWQLNEWWLWNRLQPPFYEFRFFNPPFLPNQCPVVKIVFMYSAKFRRNAKLCVRTYLSGRDLLHFSHFICVFWSQTREVFWNFSHVT